MVTATGVLMGATSSFEVLADDEGGTPGSAPVVTVSVPPERLDHCNCDRNVGAGRRRHDADGPGG